MAEVQRLQAGGFGFERGQRAPRFAARLTPEQSRREQGVEAQQNFQELMRIFRGSSTQEQQQYGIQAFRELVEEVKQVMKVGGVVPVQKEDLLRAGASFMERRFGGSFDTDALIGQATKLTNRVMEPSETRIGLQTGTASDMKIFRSDISVLSVDLQSRFSSIVAASTTAIDNFKGAIEAMTATLRSAISQIGQIQAGGTAAPGATVQASQRPTGGVSTTEASVAADIER